MEKEQTKTRNRSDANNSEDLKLDEKQRIIQKATKNTQKAKVRNIENIRVRCTQEGTDRYVVRVHHGENNFKIDLRDTLEAEKAREFVKNYTWGDPVYMSLFTVEFLGVEKTFIADMSSDKSKVINTTQDIKSVVENDSIDLRFKKNSNTIRFGKELEYRAYIPNKLDFEGLELSRENNQIVMFLSAAYVIGSIGFMMGSIFTLLSLLLFIFVTSLVGLGYKISKSTYEATTIDIDPESVKNRHNDEVIVESLSIEETENKIKLTSEEVDDYWIFDKNEFGSVSADESVIKNYNTLRGGEKVVVPLRQFNGSVDGFVGEKENFRIVT